MEYIKSDLIEKEIDSMINKLNEKVKEQTKINTLKSLQKSLCYLEAKSVLFDVKLFVIKNSERK
jgi:hypothetical protein